MSNTKVCSFNQISKNFYGLQSNKYFYLKIKRFYFTLKAKMVWLW